MEDDVLDWVGLARSLFSFEAALLFLERLHDLLSALLSGNWVGRMVLVSLAYNYNVSINRAFFNLVKSTSPELIALSR